MEKQLYDFINYHEKVTEQNPYCDEMYHADFCLAERVFRENFRSFSSLKKHQEDLVASCVANLWEYRVKFFDPDKGKYEAGAYEVCRQTIWKNTIKDEQWKFENSLVALNQPIGENTGTLIDVVDQMSVDQAEQESIDRTSENFHEVNTAVIKLKQFKNEKTQEILSLYIQGYTEEQIAEKVGCRRQYISRIKTQY